MGLTRHSRDKRSVTGAKRVSYKKKRKYELARQPALTRLSEKKISKVRVHGGNFKMRALSLNTAAVAYPSQGIGAPCKILEVAYNTDTSLQRANTLVKNAIVYVETEELKKKIKDENVKKEMG